ncbi:MAG: GNAT family N-acetyltransferase [Candidatus Methanoperedens sp.]|nr:GNAT family N-acetyltransferase [Candidatus Methanoperedens sp.]MCZ7395496.1 GNAT family N-acetyltransferase [Candidatus Methanoperedens sp.]
MIEIVSKIKDDEWKDFLDKSTKASIYHMPEWKIFLEKTFNYKSYYLFAKDECGEIAGLLPLFHVKSKLTGNRLCSVPFSHECGLICNENSVRELTNGGFNLFKDLNVDFLEIRDYIDSESFQHHNIFSTYILELSSNTGEVWQKLDKGSVRWAIKRSQKSGVSADTTKNIEDVKEFYELNCMTKKEIGVPCHPWKFFKNLFDLLKDNVSLYAARCNNELIAGGIMEYYKDTVLYGYGAANPKYLGLHPYNAFIWKSIEDACRNGYKYYDFGRTSYDNSGLIEFKKRWGTVEKKLYYSYYPKNSGFLTQNRDNLKYRIGTRVIRIMPMPIYKTFSDTIFGHFG